MQSIYGEILIQFNFEVKVMEVQIKRFSGTADINVCWLPQSVYTSLNLSREVKYNIHVGQICQHSFVDIDKTNEEAMSIPDASFDKFLLVDGLALNIRKEDGDIYLGPVVGAFINKVFLSYCKRGSAAREDAWGALSEKCLFYYFSINDVCWEENKIKGYTLSPKSNKWIAGWFPMPDIVYDRGSSFVKAEKPLVKEIRERLRSNPRISFINCCDYLGKWETNKMLAKYTEMGHYLPRTIQYSNFNDVIFTLKQHGFIFIKSYYGSEGRQVLSIERLEEGYRLVYYSGRLKDVMLKDIDEVRDMVEDYTKDNKFIIQEGIRLLKYKDRVFDMRVLIMKDSNGKWRVISNYARMAKGNLTITNYCAGGEWDHYQNIYDNLESPLCKGKIPNYEEVGAATIKIGEYLEKAFGRFGELGMDMAIDMYGKLYFIEANTKPTKDFGEGFDKKGITPLRSHAIFEYCKYLAKF
jgi:hypothetical protein